MKQSTPKWQILAVCIALAVSVALVYGQVHSYKFVSFDDYLYVVKNPHVKAGLTEQNVRWAFGFSNRAYWHPLTWLSHMADVSMFGLDAGKHHLVSVAIHAANSILLFLALFLMTKAFGPSAFVAGLFALHPINVDSVAWIAERKNVLSTFFWMVTLICYAYYAKRPGWRRYALVAAAFLMGLLAKPMLVTLPCVLLLLDFWPLNRMTGNPVGIRKSKKGATEKHRLALDKKALSRCVWEKVPLLVFSLALVIVVIRSVKGGGGRIISFVKVPLDLRVENALVSYIRYLDKMMFPRGLTFYYPYPASIPGILALGAAVFLIVLTIWFFIKRMQHPWLIVGWLWFIGTMAPVTGIIQNGLWPAIAERWAYVPLVGVYILIAWEVPSWKICHGRSRLTVAVAIAVLFVFAGLSFVQTRNWKDNEALYTHAVAVNPDNDIGQYNLANTLKRRGRLKDAVAHYLEALRINPRYVDAHYNLANIYYEKRQYKKAIAHFKKALEGSPGNTKFKDSLAKAYMKIGQTGEAIRLYKSILQKSPSYAPGYYNLGNALLSIRDYDGASKAYKEAIRLKPNFAEAYNNLAQISIRKKEFVRAKFLLQKALEIKPKLYNANFSLAKLASRQDQPQEAVKRYKVALEAKSNSYRCALGIAENLKKLGRLDESLGYYKMAVSLNPKSERAHNAFVAALKEAGEQGGTTR